jgi:hypothetical protein
MRIVRAYDRFDVEVGTSLKRQHPSQGGDPLFIRNPEEIHDIVQERIGEMYVESGRTSDGGSLEGYALACELGISHR